MGAEGLNLGGAGKVVAYVYVADRERALGFYRDLLGLAVHSEDQYGDHLTLPGGFLRVTVIPDFKPHEHPVFGFEVADIVEAARALNDRGVVFDIFEGMGQDALGVWTSPDGASKIAFFKDVDGNTLTLSEGS